MSMMRGSGPFGKAPAGAFNFRAPTTQSILYFEPSPKRIRVQLADVTVADSRRAMLMHESGRGPVYYFPHDDVRQDLLRPSPRRTHCPHKGEAWYYAVEVGGRIAEDAVWTYPEPVDDAPGIAGFLAFYWDKMDRWLEEEEEVFVHPRDPYHRVDVLRSSRTLRVQVGGRTVAQASAPRVLFETGLPPRYYIAPDDVAVEHLLNSDKRTRCPYKGLAHYKHIRLGDIEVSDAVWVYTHPLRDAQDVRGWFCFAEENEAVALHVG